jgi:hypothetical protein
MKTIILFYWLNGAIWPGPPPQELERFHGAKAMERCQMARELMRSNSVALGCATEKQWEELRKPTTK